MGEGVTARRAAVDQPLQPAEVGHPFLLQLAGEGNRLAIAVEGHQIGHRLRLAGDPQFEAVQQAIENMRRVELALPPACRAPPPSWLPYSPPG